MFVYDSELTVNEESRMLVIVEESLAAPALVKRTSLPAGRPPDQLPPVDQS